VNYNAFLIAIEFLQTPKPGSCTRFQKSFETTNIFCQNRELVMCCTNSQGPSFLENFGGTNLYCLRFDDVTVFTQPQCDLFVKLAKHGANEEMIYFGDHSLSSPLATLMMVV